MNLRDLRLPPAVGRVAVAALGRYAFDPHRSFAEQRVRLSRCFARPLVPAGTTVDRDSIGGVPVERVTTPGAVAGRTIVHFHGGGYTTGTPAQSRSWTAALSARGRAEVIAPQYRLAPEDPFPAALDDAEAVWKAAVTGSRPPVLAGDSAGGGLAAALAARLRERGQTPPAGLVLVCPWLDLTADRRADSALVRRDVLLSPDWLESCAQAYAGGHGLDDPEVSPLLGSADGLPPTLVFGAGDDLLVGDADRWVVTARAAGVDTRYLRAPRLWHGYPLSPGLLAAADRAVEAAGAFVERVLGA